MEVQELIEQIRNFKPFNEQECNDRFELIYLLETTPDIFLRENRQYHMTASAWVVNHDKTKVLMAYHNIYNSWSWLGGHADGEVDLLEVALREVQEESGVSQTYPVMNDIFSLEILTVDGHEKKGEYVPSHLHLNVTYLIEADEKEFLKIKDDENSAVAWYDLDDAVKASTEPWFRERIYTKLNQKLRTIYEK